MLSLLHERNASHNHSGDDDDASASLAYTFLSLFLLVLSFFVVLTVLSEVVQERVEQTLSSIAKVFSTNTTESKDGFNVERLSAGFSEDFILEEIELLINTNIHVARTTRNDSEGSLEVRVRNQALFDADSPDLRSEMLILLRRISATIANSRRPIYTSFVTGYKSNDVYVFSPPLSVRRASELGRIAVLEGIDPERLQSGLDRSLTDETVFQFRIGDSTFPSVLYIPEDALLQPLAEPETPPNDGVQVETGAQPQQTEPPQQTEQTEQPQQPLQP